MPNETIVLPTAPKAGGILLSALCHVLILLIPLSLATKAPPTFPPVEFVMTLAEKPMASETPPRTVEPPKPEPVRPKRKIKPRPRPKPVVTEPVETKTFIPQPVAAVPKPSPVPSRAAGAGTGRNTGPYVTDFGSATGPAFLRRVMPVYPAQARRLGQEGRVVLRLTIDARGNLLKVVVLQGPGYGFEEAAVEAVKRSSFRPAIVNGQAVASSARLPIRFALRN
jgi:protein TonB